MAQKVSFPSMGWSKIAFKALYELIPGVEVVYPPEVNRDIVQLGAKYSPEFVCFPFKVTLGEFINMLEKYDVHTFIMSIDCGPCRLGFYAPIQERILKDLGYDVTIIPIQQADLLNFEWLEPFYKLTAVKGKIMRMYDIVQSVRMAFLKASLIEDITHLEGLIRCREGHKGDTTRVVSKLMMLLNNERDFIALHRFDQIIRQEFRKISIHRNLEPLRIMVTGENHIVMEPFINMDIVKKFGEEGVEVHLGNSLMDWVQHKLHINFNRKQLERLSQAYIPLDIGGEAQWVLGNYMRCMQEGFDGFIHAYPFTCMPEVAARGIFEGQSPDPFYIPIQFYSFDEHTGFEGMRTRLESFIDLMKLNRQNNPQFQRSYIEPVEIQRIYDEPDKYWGFNRFCEDFLNPFMNNIQMLSFPRNLIPKISVTKKKTDNSTSKSLQNGSKGYEFVVSEEPAILTKEEK